MLDDLERSFRVPPASQGVPYQGDKPSGRLRLAQFYLNSVGGAPSAESYNFV